MPKEYEHAFFNFNKVDIISKIKSLKGKHKGTYLFKVQIFNHPLDTPGTYIRVRDEGFRTTMTYKYKGPKDEFSDEHEVNIDNYETAINILLGIGCKKKSYYEKIREIWNVKNTEVIFDTNPGIDDRLEVESKTKKEMTEMIKTFNLKIVDTTNRYADKFGIILPKTIDLTFNNVKKNLIKIVTKNKKEFIELCDNQLSQYKKLIKSKK